MDQPHDGLHFKQDELEECDNYMYKSVASYFLLNPNSRMSYLFNVGIMRFDICLIYYMENHILFSSKRNSSHLTRSYISAVWLLANKIETKWEISMIQHMLGRKRKVICLPYGDLVTNILEHVGYNF